VNDAKPPYFTDEQWQQELWQHGQDRLPPKPPAADKAPRFSDEDLALRFADNHASGARYVAASNRWLFFDGKVWRHDETRMVFTHSRIVCRAAAREAAALTDKPTLPKSIASAKTVAAVENLARADLRIAARQDQWDADPWLLNTPAGVVDLRTGALRAHRAEDYMTKTTAVGPAGECPMFLAFIDRIMARDDELIAFIQRTLGYCLTGITSEQAIFFAYGTGQNGKGVLTSIVSWILKDYCCATPIETFTESKSDRHPTEMARLHGVRMVTSSETESGRYWAETRLKELTGGDKVPARFMRQDFFEYKPQFKPFISGNHKPRLHSPGPAMRRRLNMIPFAVEIPAAERDLDLVDKLKAEASGILQWMIEGCLAWQTSRLAQPLAVRKATDEYFASEDGVQNWIADKCDIMATASTKSSELFASWKDWAQSAGLHLGDSKSFREELERLGFSHIHRKNGNFFNGLFVRPDESRPRFPDE
jgi:putative DNA primase/helicase